MQAVLLASIRQGKRVLQRLDGPNVPPPGAYTTNRCLLKSYRYVPGNSIQVKHTLLWCWTHASVQRFLAGAERTLSHSGK